MLAIVLNGIGMVAIKREEYQRAQEALEQSLHVFQDLQRVNGMGTVLVNSVKLRQYTTI